MIIGKIVDNNEHEYRAQVNSFVQWCDDNYLNLKVKKTKEIVIDSRKKEKCIEKLTIKEENVDIVHDYKYLGVEIDDRLTGDVNTRRVYGKCMQRIHFLRILTNVKVDNTIRSMFYKSIVESILYFGMTPFYGSLTVKNKNKQKQTKVVKLARKLGANVTALDDLYSKNALKIKKMSDITPPLNNKYVFLRSGKRLVLPTQKTSRFKNSFVPVSIKLYNSMNSKR